MAQAADAQGDTALGSTVRKVALAKSSSAKLEQAEAYLEPLSKRKDAAGVAAYQRALAVLTGPLLQGTS
jgi:hypothetical protein